MQSSQVFKMPKNAFLHCFHYQFLKFALEKQIRSYAVVASVQHAEKRVFALFSSSIFENCFRNANKGICSGRKWSTCRKNAFLQCLHNQFLKTALETRIKAFAAVANVHHAEKSVFSLFYSSTFEIHSRNANKGICSSCKCSTCRKTRFCTVFIINF